MYCSSFGTLVSERAEPSSRAKKGLEGGCRWMKQWSFYCKRKLCHGIGASEQQGGGQGDASRNTWFGCVLRLLIRTLLQKHSHARRPPLVTASQIALSPMVLLLATTSRLFSRPLPILLCCLISKDFPYPGSESQLDITLLVCMHPHHFPIGSPFFSPTS